jgi:hypothetical protein
VNHLLHGHFHYALLDKRKLQLVYKQHDVVFFFLSETFKLKTTAFCVGVMHCVLSQAFPSWFSETRVSLNVALPLVISPKRFSLVGLLCVIPHGTTACVSMGFFFFFWKQCYV